MDLLNKLNDKSSKTAEGTGSPGPNQAEKIMTTEARSSMSAGDDLIKMAGNGKPEAAATAKADSAGGDEKTKSSKEESSGNELVKDPDSWTKESALKEIKRLREENKTYRLKYEEKVSGLTAEMEAKIKQKEEELRSAETIKQELEELKAKEADKKRDLSEKLAHREALLSELKAKEDAKEKMFKEQLDSLSKKLNIYEAEREAESAVYKQRLSNEINSIPEKYKDIADLIIKGAGDPREALVALNEAKLRGVFEDKTVVVNHSVPGAKDGARATNERLQEAVKEERSKLSPQQKIALGLKGIRAGEPNSIYRR